MKEQIEKIIKGLGVDKSRIGITCHPDLIPIIEELGIKKIYPSTEIPLDIISVIVNRPIEEAIKEYLEQLRN